HGARRQGGLVLVTDGEVLVGVYANGCDALVLCREDSAVARDAPRAEHHINPTGDHREGGGLAPLGVVEGLGDVNVAVVDHLRVDVGLDGLGSRFVTLAIAPYRSPGVGPAATTDFARL